MKLKVIVMALLMMFAAVAVEARSTSVEYTVQTIEDHARVKTFEYESYEKACAKVEEQASNELLTAKKTAKLLRDVPPGGVLHMELLGSNWAMANGINWTYVITDESGNELFRSRGYDYDEPAPAYERRTIVKEGRHRTKVYTREVQVAPEKTLFGDPVYVCRDRIDIPVSLPDVFKVYVADGINKKRCSYLLKRGM
jgi:hypothetical protein